MLLQPGSSAACRARPASRRGSVGNVYNVFSLSTAVGGLMRPRQAGSSSSSKPSLRPSVASVMEVPAAPASPGLHPRKAVQGVPLKDRSTVELMMAITSLATEPVDSLAMQLAEHELALVTTSATCDAMFASVLDSCSEDYGSAGDGMATPLADIRAAAEQMAAEVRGSSIASDWNPSSSGGSASSSFSGAPGSRHALEQLTAQADYTSLSGSSSSNGSSRDAGSVMARVHALQQQIKAAASKARAGASGSASGSNGNGHSSNKGAAAARAAAAASSAAAGHGKATAAAAPGSRPASPVMVRSEEPRLQRGQQAMTESFDEDSCGDAAAMPVIPGFGSPAAAGAAAAGPYAARGLPFGRAVAAAAPSYPVYEDPASSWLVADSADGATRIIAVRAPAKLSAKVSGARASADLTTFESYSLGAKINKALYNEANALYNRFMPLLLDHLEEAGPSGRIMLCGSGLGGSLAALLLLMFVARGMRASAFAPVYTLNAPAVLCEVPDFKQWCSKDGCSLQDMDGMMEDLLHRGILSQLGLPQDAVRNIYHNQGAAEAAVQAVQSKLGPLAAVAASGSKQLGSMVVQHLDVDALAASPYVPQVLKSWLRSEASGEHAAMQRLHILNPVGKMLLYVAGGPAA